MASAFTIGVLSDIHFAGAAEQARGDDYELRGLKRPALRWLLRTYRRFIWLHQPLRQNHLLDQFLNRIGPVESVVANGDFSCDSGFVGLSDDAAFESARECLEKLRQQFGDRFHATFGDHELGKFSMVGRRGGMRLAALERAQNELKLPPFWTREIGNHLLVGIASSLVALPAMASEILPEEKARWEKLRAGHLENIRTAFSRLKPDQRVLLFCHDPTALPFLWREAAVRERLAQVDLTIIGHLHSNLIFRQSQWLAGMPEIRFAGHAIRKMTRALGEARYWKPFNVQLCPSLAGVELLKDGGFLTLELSEDHRAAPRVTRHRIKR
jgi:hypothetical protein